VRRASGISSESCPAGESIAAVSFENLNSEQNSAFLAHEMNDDPLTKLAKIPDMKVGRPPQQLHHLWTQAKQWSPPSSNREEEMIRNARIGANSFIDFFASASRAARFCSR
jgi:hypothetical protein